MTSLNDDSAFYDDANMTSLYVGHGKPSEETICGQRPFESADLPGITYSCSPRFSLHARTEWYMHTFARTFPWNSRGLRLTIDGMRPPRFSRNRRSTQELNNLVALSSASATSQLRGYVVSIAIILNFAKVAQRERPAGGVHPITELLLLVFLSVLYLWNVKQRWNYTPLKIPRTSLTASENLLTG